jgi:hypothetical protein
MGITGLSHFYFETKNYIEAKKFWEGLGFKNTLDLSQSTGEGAGLYSNGSLQLMLRQVSTEPIEEIYFKMGNPDATTQRLKSEGQVKITKDLFDSHWDTKLVQVQDPDGRKLYLEAGHEKYEASAAETTKMIVNLAVLTDSETLFVKYANLPDHQKGWFVPHRTLMRNEDPKAICKQIASEQLGLSWSQDMKLELHQIQSFVGNDGTWHLSYDHSLHVKDASALKKAANISSAEWFPLSHPPARSEVAHHGWALDIVQAIQKAD